MLSAWPYVGEFGWEICSWQGRVRRLAKGHDRVIVSCPAGHEHLYVDFAHEFIPHPVPPAGSSDCWRGPAAPADVLAALEAMPGERIAPDRHYTLEEQDFIRYGDAQRVAPEDRFDALVHARGLFGRRAADSWPQQAWDALMRDLTGARVGAIGSRDGALLPAGAADLRGLPLQDLCDRIAAAKIVAGPSSAPLHLASLCGTRHLVWGSTRYFSVSKGTVRSKFESGWSPFKTPVQVIDEHGWRPPPRKIANAILETLR